VAAVVKGFEKMGHWVRMVVTQNDRLVWGDQLQNWSPASYHLTRSLGFKLVERPVRRLQSEMHLPYISLFDSLRYADAAVPLLQGYTILYERHGYMGYGGVITARRLGMPLVLELNGNILKEIDEMGVKMSPIQRRIGRWITRTTFLAANHVVVVSDALRQHLVEDLQIPLDKVSVVLNGVDLELFSQPRDEQHTRQIYNLGPGPVITFVGSFQPWHGVEYLVSSFKLVQEQCPDAQLILVGDGAARDQIMAQLTQLGLQDKTILTGRLPQEQVASVVQAADVLVAPYGFKHGDIVGTPLKLLEYLAAGKAIVASTAPIHELITDGVNGLRVEPAESRALAQGIIRLLTDPALRTRLGAAARQQAQQYSWDGVVEKLQRIFMEQLAINPERLTKSRSALA
jgi:glycosyltransferase involved in cell wall biosynthesis